jgi:iron complex transport system substrate-binding protein
MTRIAFRPIRCCAQVAALAATLLSTAAQAEPRFVVDAAGRRVEIADASRVVAIGGSVTEILYALGAADRIAGVDQTSTFPEAAGKKPNVGYMRALSAEGVLSLAPTLVLAIEGSGPLDVIEVLTKASVPFVLVPEAHDREGVLRKIRFIADAIGMQAEGEKVALAVREDFDALSAIRGKIERRRKALFVLAIGGGAPIIGGRDSSAAAIFALAGVENAFDRITGYKPVSDEAALAAEPDAIVVMAERGHAMTAEAVFSLPAFAATPAAKARRLIALPGLYLLGFGPRTAHAARDLAAKLYPEVKIPALAARPWTGPGDGAQ